MGVDDRQLLDALLSISNHLQQSEINKIDKSVLMADMREIKVRMRSFDKMFESANEFRKEVRSTISEMQTQFMTKADCSNHSDSLLWGVAFRAAVIVASFMSVSGGVVWAILR